MIRKSLAWLLAVVMLFGLVVPGQAFAAEAQGAPLETQAVALDVDNYSVAIKDAGGNAIGGVHGVYYSQNTPYKKFVVFVPENTTGTLDLKGIRGGNTVTGPLAISLNGSEYNEPGVTYESSTKTLAVASVLEPDSSARHTSGFITGGCALEIRIYRGTLATVLVNDVNGVPYTGAVLTNFSFPDGARFSVDYATNGLVLMNMPTKAPADADLYLSVRPDSWTQGEAQTNSVVVNVKGVVKQAGKDFLEFGQLQFQKPTFVGTLYAKDGTTAFRNTALNVEYREPGKDIIRVGLTAYPVTVAGANGAAGVEKKMFCAAPFGPGFQEDYYVAWTGVKEGTKFEGPVNFPNQVTNPGAVQKADFVAFDAFGVQFDLNGGIDGTKYKEVPVIFVNGVNVGGKLIESEIKSPTKAGFTFAGWYKNEALDVPWNFATDIVSANTILYAKWQDNALIGKHVFEGTIARPAGTTEALTLYLHSEGHDDKNYDITSFVIPENQASISFRYAVPVANRTSFGFSVQTTYDDAIFWGVYSANKVGQLSLKPKEMTMVPAQEGTTKVDIVIPETDVVRFELTDPLDLYNQQKFLSSARIFAADASDDEMVASLNMGSKHSPDRNVGLRLLRSNQNIRYTVLIDAEKYDDSPYFPYAYVKQLPDKRFVLVKNKADATTFPSAQATAMISVTALTQNIKSISGNVKLPVGYPTNHPDIKVQIQTENMNNDGFASKTVVIPAGSSEAAYNLFVPTKGLTSLKLSVRPDSLMWGYYCEANASTNRILFWEDATVLRVTDDAPLVLKPITLEASEKVSFTVNNPQNLPGHWLSIYAHGFDAARPSDDGILIGDTGLLIEEISASGKTGTLNLAIGSKNFMVGLTLYHEGNETTQYLKKTGNAYAMTSNRGEATLFANTAELSGFTVDMIPYVPQVKTISGTLKLPASYPAVHPDLKIVVELYSNDIFSVAKTVVIPANLREVGYTLDLPMEGASNFKLSLKPEMMLWGYYNTAKTDTNQSLLWEDATPVAVTDNQPLTLNPMTLEASDQVSFTIANPENLQGDWLGIYADAYSLANPPAPIKAVGAIEMGFDEVNSATKPFIFNIAKEARNFLMPVYSYIGDVGTWQFVKKAGTKFELTSNSNEATYFSSAAALAGMHLDLKAYQTPAVATTIELTGPSTVESSLTAHLNAFFTAVIKDQNGKAMPNMNVVYSIKIPVTGIYIDAETGLAEIEDIAVAGVPFTVVATYQLRSGTILKVEKTVAVTKQLPSNGNDITSFMLSDETAHLVDVLRGFTSAKQSYQLDGLTAGHVMEIHYWPADYATSVIKFNGTILGPTTTTGPNFRQLKFTLKQGVNIMTIEVTSQSGLKKMYTLDLIVPIPNDSAPVTIGTGDNKVVKIPTDFKATDTVEIKIDPAVKDAKIQLGAPIENATSKEIQVAGALSFKTATSGAAGGPSINVEMPAGIKISTPKANGWDGTIGLPSITQTAGSTAVEVGLPDMALTFDKPVRIVLPGMAGKKAQWSRGGTVQEITTVLTEDTAAAAGLLLVGAVQEARIDVGQDLVIWTMHFTEFKAYMPAPVDNGGGNPGGNTGGSTGGSTGGNTGGAPVGNPAGTGGAVVTPAIPVTPVVPVVPVTPVVGTIVANPGDLIVPYGSAKFSDIASVTWAQEAISYLTAKDVITLNSSKQFNPNGKLTRAEFATMIVRYLKLTVANTPAAGPKFKDIKATDWFAKDVQAAVAAGLMKGINSSNDRFNPNGLVTRQEIAAVIGRVLVKEGVKLDKNPSPDLFKAMKDNTLVATWAQDGAKLAVQEGIITGRDRLMNNQKISLFVPQDTATRAEFAVMLFRLANR